MSFDDDPNNERCIEPLSSGSGRSVENANHILPVRTPGVEYNTRDSIPGVLRAQNVTQSNGMFYRGGKLKLGAVNVYFVFYGNWQGDGNQLSLIMNFISDMSGSKYYNINTTYSDSRGRAVSNSLAMAGYGYYPHGKILVDNDIKNIVKDAISNHLVFSPSPSGTDPNGIYFVMTSADVSEGNYCSVYCAWHNFDGDLKYSFIGNPANCPGRRTGVSPNGNVAVGSIISTLAHDLEETTSDPNLDAWAASDGSEN